jgi:hypothetical protein
MKLYGSNVEAKKLMTRMVAVRALSAFSASLSQPRDARQGVLNRDTLRPNIKCTHTVQI